MGSSALKQIQENDHHIEAGEGRTLGYQALMQLLGLGITLAVSIVTGLVTGTIMSVNTLCDVINDDQLFDDELFWEVAEDDNPGYDVNKTISRRHSRMRSQSLSKVGPEGNKLPFDGEEFASLDNNNHPVQL